MEILVGSQLWKVSRFGKGEKHLIALHGYGQDSTWFRHHEEIFGNSYTVYTIDLAYHGSQSSLPKGLLFDELYARKWMEAILEKTGQSKIGFLAYSIGARIALSLASWFPETISELLLLAPDGMPVSKTYKWLTSSYFGPIVFKSFISSPEFAFRLINSGRRLGFLSKKVADFYSNEIGSISKRQKLFDTWMFYRKAIPNYNELPGIIKRNQVPVTCILGKDDKVIPLKSTKNFATKKLARLEIIELDLGHNLLSDKGARLLADFWK
jgi:pimeloyl-ACP methyl ester carboxylesterase